jgi:predicted glycosyltransferase involved in capsule biosynthesis
MKISALMPYKSDNGERDVLFEFVKKRYEELMPHVELCIGIDNSEYFNRSKAINNAAKIATGDIFMTVDSDVIFNPNLIDNIINNIDNYPWIIPFTNGFRLNKGATVRILEEDPTADICSGIISSDVESNCVIEGAFLNVMKRECFEKVGGMDERFRGWGCEDEALVRSLDIIYGVHGKLNDNVFHLWHNPAAVNWDIYWNNFSVLLGSYRNAMYDYNKMMEIINEKNLLQNK